MTIAFFLYSGRPACHLELSYSVASIARFDAGTRMLLITDEANRRPDLPVEHLIFNDADFARWTNQGAYHHAAKVHALRLALDHVEGALALVDTDTYFRAAPGALLSSIGPGRSVMHAHEGAVGDHDTWRPLLQKAPRVVAGFEISARCVMNNSGVIGLHSDDRHLLDDAVPLMRCLRDIHPLFNIEQFAVSAALARATDITTVEHLVHHYWGFERRFVHCHLQAHWAERSDASFDALKRSFRPIGFPPKRLGDQLAARAWGALRRWDGDYRFAYLAQRSALSSPDSGLANAWAQVAADALARLKVEPADVRRDFARLLVPAAWHDGATRSLWGGIDAQLRASLEQKTLLEFRVP